MVLLDLLDTSGAEEFSAMRDQYMRGAELFLIACSFADPKTDYLAELDALVSRIFLVKDDDRRLSPIIIVRTKADLFFC